MKTIAIILVFVCLFLSCRSQTGADDVDTENIKSEFSFSILSVEVEEDGSVSDSIRTFSGGKESQWSPDIGTILLLTDDGVEPAAILIIGLNSSNSVISAILTTGDKTVGTGEKINGKTYTLTTGKALIEEINTAYIKSNSFKLIMKREIINQNDVPEDISVEGSFTVLSN